MLNKRRTKMKQKTIKVLFKKETYIFNNEKANLSYWRYFAIIEKIPEVGDIFAGDKVIELRELKPDIENSNEVFDYDLYEVECADEFSDRWVLACAIKKEEKE
jgi:hypothetical protein